jgi:mxaL protein
MSGPCWRHVSSDPRSLCLGGAFACLLAAVLAPHLVIERSAYELLAAVDVTGSMNARDYTLDGRPAARLEKVERVLRDLLVHLPCGSRMGLAVFTERRTFLLFEPVDVCRDFAPLDGALAALDWRMAWEGDSQITSGLYSAVEIANGLGADLVFLTDGHEAPPLPHGGPLPFEGEVGSVRGLVVGVGGTALVPIPKFDARGHEIGFYEMSDVPQENRFGPPPRNVEERDGWHPRNAPFGAETAVGNEHLTSVREHHLRALAATVGFAYAPLADASDLAEAIRREARPHPVAAPADLAPVPASLALLLFVVLFAALPLRERGRVPFIHIPRIFFRCRD